MGKTKKKMSKKERAELSRQKAQEEKTKKAETKEEKKEKKKFRWNRVVGFLIVLLAIFCLVWAGAFLYVRLFGAKPLAKILPAEKTVAFLELNFNNTQNQKLADLFQDYPQFQLENLHTEFEDLTGIDLTGKANEWLGKKWGLAIFTPKRKDEPFRKVVFVETRNKAATLEHLQSLELDEQQGFVSDEYGNNYTLYQYWGTQRFKFTFLQRYLVLAEDLVTLQEIIDQYEIQTGLVRQDENYIEIANNLPSREWGFGYVNGELAVDNLFTWPWIDRLTQLELGLMKPVLRIFPAAGLSLAVTDEALVMQNYISIQKSALKDQRYFSFAEKYQGKLLSLVEEDMDWVKGGHNLEGEFKRMLEILKEVNSVTTLTVEAALRGKLEEFLGTEISLEKDIYPLLAKEYLLTYKNQEDKGIWKFILELEDKESTWETLERIKNKFVEKSALLAPVVKEVVLADGTVGKEIVANPEQIVEEDHYVGDFHVHSLKITNQPWTVYWAFENGRLFLTNDLESLEASLSWYKLDGVEESVFQEAAKPVMLAADEVMIGDVKAWAAKIENEKWKKYLEPFGFLRVGKNTFEDGISTIYYLEVDRREEILSRKLGTFGFPSADFR